MAKDKDRDKDKDKAKGRGASAAAAGQDMPAHQLLWHLERLARLLRAEGHSGALNPVQWEVLRYLARANRFSNSPGALTKFLCTTKGTMSQTIMALERKGLLRKAPRAGERRSVALALSEAGEAALSGDPLAGFLTLLDQLSPKTRRRLGKGAKALVEAAVMAAGQPSFGSCESCRYFRERGDESVAGQAPHFCMYFEAGLSSAETRQICIAHQART